MTNGFFYILGVMVSLALGDLVRAIPEVWCPETRGNESYTGDHPAAGQCVVSSLLIQRHCGGDIIRCQVGGESWRRVVHYFNELPGGVKIDVTGAQFDRRSPYRMFQVNPPVKRYIFNDTWERVDLMEWLVKQWLAN